GPARSTGRITEAWRNPHQNSCVATTTHLAPDRSHDLPSPLLDAADQLPELGERRSQRRIADLYRQHRVLECGECVVCLAGRDDCVVDERFRANRREAWGWRFERAARQSVATGELRVGASCAAVGQLNGPEELFLELGCMALVELLVSRAERCVREADLLGCLREGVEEFL